MITTATRKDTDGNLIAHQSTITLNLISILMLMFTINAIQNCICINLFYDSVKLNVNHTCLFMQGLNTNTLNLVVCASALSCFIIEIQFVDNVIIMKPKGHLTQVTVFHVWLFCLNLLVY